MTTTLGACLVEAGRLGAGRAYSLLGILDKDNKPVPFKVGDMNYNRTERKFKVLADGQAGAADQHGNLNAPAAGNVTNAGANRNLATQTVVNRLQVEKQKARLYAGLLLYRGFDSSNWLFQCCARCCRRLSDNYCTRLVTLQRSRRTGCRCATWFVIMSSVNNKRPCSATATCST